MHNLHEEHPSSASTTSYDALIRGSEDLNREVRLDIPDKYFRELRRAERTLRQMGRNAYPTIGMIPNLDLGRKKPFSDHHLILVPHLRMSAETFVAAAIRMGADPPKITVFYKGYLYPEGAEVQTRLRCLGVIVVPLDQKTAELTRIKAELGAVGSRLAVYDDGAEIIPDIIADAHLSALTGGFVEQTTRGRDKLLLLRIRQPVLSLPDSKFKATFECGSVGEAAMDALEWHAGGPQAGKRLAVVGAAGVIGLAFAREAAARGLRVRGFDIAPKDPYFALNNFQRIRVCSTKLEALVDADFVVGATGRKSISQNDLPFLRDGAILGSISSGQVELPLKEIEDSADAVQPFRIAGDRDPHGATYSMKWGRTITVLDGGRPLNLGVAAGPEAECFDLVMAVILVGLAEVAAGEFEGHAGLLDCFDDLIRRHDLPSVYMSFHGSAEAA